jgi:uncharacterized protein (UPF0333 family)
MLSSGRFRTFPPSLLNGRVDRRVRGRARLDGYMSDPKRSVRYPCGNRMSNSHSRGEPHQHQRLAERFEQRAARLRRQANILLYIIIGVLAVGAGAFVFANDISRFTLQPRTAEDQYAVAEAAEKKNRDELNQLSKQIKEIMDTVTIPPSYDENLNKISSEYTTFEQNILQKCKDIINTNITTRQNLTNNDFEMRPSLSTNFDIRPSIRIGEYTLAAPLGAVIDFSNASSAGECRSIFLQSQDEITHYLRLIQDRLSERDAARQEMIKSREPTLKPLQQSSSRLMMEYQRLDALRNQLQSLVTQEKILGSPAKPEAGATSAQMHSDSTGTRSSLARIASADWVQTNGFGLALCSAR